MNDAGVSFLHDVLLQKGNTMAPGRGNDVPRWGRKKAFSPCGLKARLLAAVGASHPEKGRPANAALAAIATRCRLGAIRPSFHLRRPGTATRTTAMMDDAALRRLFVKDVGTGKIRFTRKGVEAFRQDFAKVGVDINQITTPAQFSAAS